MSNDTRPPEEAAGAAAVPAVNPRRPTHIVGVGASAGGLEALERLFAAMPADTGAAFVVVQHLSPDFKSLTDELLARRTPIPIHRVEDGMEAERDAIYLIPPKKDMIIAGGKLLLTDKDPSQAVALPIDHFFRSLAQELGDRAVAVVLSGTGSDGSRGVRDVHEAGGLVIAQAPESAKFDGMPNSAVRTGAVDWVLPPEEIPAALVKYLQRPGERPEKQGAPPADAGGGMDAVFRMLRDAYGIDFSHYKPSTVARRVERRIFLNGAGDLDEFVERLAREPDELNALYKDLLIGVTRFFRDRPAFERLEEVLPQLVEQVGADDELRVWSAGCATGEEAYSVAILVRECLERAGKAVRVKVLATDVHPASLAAAGDGVYGEDVVADVSTERLARHFVRRDGGFQVAPELRKMVVFAQHNLIKDAPFTKLDLVVCRNLLIYLQPAVQKKALSLFHFALRTGGVLLLGPSETPGDLEAEFDVLDVRWKLYRKRRDVRLSPTVRLPTTVAAPGRRTAGVAALPASSLPDAHLVSVYDTLLEEYLPPSLLVNEYREVVQSFSGASRYLQLRDGRISTDVLDMVGGEMKMALTGALQRAFKEQKPVAYKGLRVPTPEGERLINVSVKPLPARRGRPGPLHVLVLLEDAGAPPPPAPAAHEIDHDQASQDQLQSLESELRYTKENLQATIEELETSNEELQATNEELVAANEELQSTNEELHSVNEELHTVNAEYQKKIAELTELTADMDNLLTSTQVHTMFLDRELCVRKFTPRMGETFHLLPQDVGRRIDNFTHSIDHPGLLDDLKEVLRTSEPVEKPVRDRQGNWFLMRVLPYRSGASVGGVVLTLIDINGLKRAEAEAHKLGQELGGILRTSPSLVSVRDLQGRYVLAGDAFRSLVGRDPAGKTAHELFPKEIADILTAGEDRVIGEGTDVQTEVVIPREDGPHTYLSVKFPLRDEAGRINGVGGIATDVTRLKEAERQALEAAAARDRFLAMLSHELRNPLAAVVNAAGVIAALGPGAPAAAEWLRVIERRSRHMARLLDDLLDAARVTQNKIAVRKQVFDLASTLDDAVEEVRPWFTGGPELTVRRPDGPLPVDGDPTRLQQIQVNLLLNAAKYTRKGGRVWYAMAREGDEAVIRVRDTGMGIPPEMREKIFDLFTQGPNAPERTDRGLGVGLTLVRAIAALHGGTVQAHSDGPGRGSEFVIRLPLAPAAPAGGTPVPRVGGTDAAGAPPAAAAPLRLLVVEDDADIRESLQMVLEIDGHAVRTAADGPAALAALGEQAPDAALLDIGLPGMDGYALARRVRERFGPGRPYLVALTGYGRPTDREAAREAGFDAHLTKPVNPKELERMLRSLPRGEK